MYLRNEKAIRIHLIGGTLNTLEMNFGKVKVEHIKQSTNLEMNHSCLDISALQNINSSSKL